MSGPKINYPPGVESDEEKRAFDRGWASAMKLVSGAAREWANQLEPGDGGGPEPAAVEDDERCSECGADLLRTMGSEDLVCPVCD